MTYDKFTREELYPSEATVIPDEWPRPSLPGTTTYHITFERDASAAEVTRVVAKYANFGAPSDRHRHPNGNEHVYVTVPTESASEMSELLYNDRSVLRYHFRAAPFAIAMTEPAVQKSPQEK